MRRLSRITERLYGQPMFKLLARAQELEAEGRQIIHFEIGDPDFASPECARMAASGALERGATHYTNSMGLLEFREAVGQFTSEHWGFAPGIEQILICPANAIIDFVVRCVADPDDEVIIPDPGFPTYESVLSYTKIVPVRLPLRPETEFKMTAAEISQRITERTKLIILNSPSNPTGAVLDEDEVIEIAELAEQANLFVLSDEVYWNIIYESKHFSVSALDECRERTILLNSLSKTFAMSGWRLGYAIGPEQLIEKMGLLLQTILSCLPPFTQYGGAAVLEGGVSYSQEMVMTLKERRDLLVTELNDIDGIHCSSPRGAFYAFPAVRHPGMTGFEYAERLLVDEGICLLPGSCFGDSSSEFVRLSYSGTPRDSILEAMNRMKRFHVRHFCL